MQIRIPTFADVENFCLSPAVSRTSSVEGGAAQTTCKIQPIDSISIYTENFFPIFSYVVTRKKLSKNIFAQQNPHKLNTRHISEYPPYINDRNSLCEFSCTNVIKQSDHIFFILTRQKRPPTFDFNCLLPILQTRYCSFY